jgi:hypothetical protein
MRVGFVSLLSLGIVTLACADRSSIDDDIGASDSTESGESDGASESSDSDSSTDSTDSETTDSETTDSETTDSSEDDSSTDSETTDSTDGMLEEVTYYAEPYIGGIDRLWIFRVDPFTDTCAKLSVRHDWSDFEQFDVVTPMDWTLEYVQVSAGLDCDGGEPLGSATAGTGFVQFNDYDPLDTFPCDVDVDAQFDLDSDPPSMIDFTATGLTPEGVGC